MPDPITTALSICHQSVIVLDQNYQWFGNHHRLLSENFVCSVCRAIVLPHWKNPKIKFNLLAGGGLTKQNYLL